MDLAGGAADEPRDAHAMEGAAGTGGIKKILTRRSVEGERVTCPAPVAGGTGGGRRSCVRTYKQTTAGLVIQLVLAVMSPAMRRDLGEEIR